MAQETLEARLERYREYRRQGGHLPYGVWSEEIAGDPVREAEREAAAVDITGAPPTGGEFEFASFPTEDPPPGYHWERSSLTGQWEPAFGETQQQGPFPQVGGTPAVPPAQPPDLSPFDQFRFGWQGPGPEPTPTPVPGIPAQAPTEPFWNPNTGQWETPPGWISPFQQGQLDLQQQQMQQEVEMRRQQEMARLAANPMSWLQFASFTGEAPLVQPWMVPLGAQQQGLQVGQELPGFGGQGESFSGLPELTTPSAQLQARWGPTAQRQWLGFQQARTGATPEESSFRRRAGAPPGGSFGGLRRLR